MNQSDTRKPKIGWIEISTKKYGGFVYRQQAREALEKKFDVEMVSCEPKYLKKFRYLKMLEAFLNVFRLKGNKDIWIRDYFPALMMRTQKTTGKNVVMIHHIDISGLPFFSRPVFWILTKILYKNLKNADAIITRAEMWRKHFIDKGFKNVFKIYGGFNTEKFDIPQHEVDDFKARNGLQGKPIIYIGNCQKAKGVVQTYNALKDLDVYLVTTGQKDVEIPAKHFILSYEDYLKLLKASDVVVTMSVFKEGWCRTAHEAMLCKTPVIGSGSGGMKELLEGGKQIICKDFNQLRKEVDFLLENKKSRQLLGENGYNFTKEFTVERFNQEWQEVMDKIISLKDK